jgi:hypothetical protein
MKVYDSISIAGNGYSQDSLTLGELYAFVDNVRQHDGVLIMNSEQTDHRSVTYDFIKAADLSDHANLKIHSDTPWLLAEKLDSYKRKNGEDVDDWKKRIAADIQRQGYVLRGNGPIFVALLVLDDKISGYKVTGNMLKIDSDSTLYSIHPYCQ